MQDDGALRFVLGQDPIDFRAFRRISSCSDTAASGSCSNWFRMLRVEKRTGIANQAVWWRTAVGTSMGYQSTNAKKQDREFDPIGATDLLRSQKRKRHCTQSTDSA